MRRSNDGSHRPILAKNLKLPKVFTITKLATEEGAFDYGPAHHMKTRNSIGVGVGDDEIPILGKPPKYEILTSKRNGESRRDVVNRSAHHAEGLAKKGDYRTYKPESLYQNPRIGNKAVRGSHSCPKYFNVDNRYQEKPRLLFIAQFFRLL